MNKWDVSNEGDALAYITECTLATVGHMAMTKSRKKGEYVRQISIAQHAIDWMDRFGIDYSQTRAADAKFAGSVADWARKFEP